MLAGGGIVNKRQRNYWERRFHHFTRRAQTWEEIDSQRAMEMQRHADEALRLLQEADSLWLLVREGES